ncbi:MAG: GNAT family N-acetyltransferase [Bacteroidota bacterium]
MNPIKIRQATAADAELVADMSRRAFFATFGPMNTKEDIEKYMSVQFSRELLMDEVGAPGNIFLLAYLQDEPVGIVKLKENSIETGLDAQNPIEIARFYAMPEMVGKGVGKAMMQYCIAFAKERGNDALWLGVWEQNQRAIAFYTAFGYEKFGEHGFLLGDDMQNDWVMLKRV